MTEGKRNSIRAGRDIHVRDIYQDYENRGRDALELDIATMQTFMEAFEQMLRRSDLSRRLLEAGGPLPTDLVVRFKYFASIMIEVDETMAPSLKKYAESICQVLQLPTTWLM